MRGNQGLDALKRLLLLFPPLYVCALALRASPDQMSMILCRLAKRGDTVMEIGANRGQYTELLGRLVGRQGKVVAFEPIPMTFVDLVERTKTLAHVSCEELAVSDHSGQVRMCVPSDDLQQASMLEHSEGSWRNEGRSYYWVHSATLDGFCESHNITKIDILKVDIEGAEILLLKGGARTIKATSPLVIIEVNDAWLKTSGGDHSTLVSMMLSLGYRDVYKVDVGRISMKFVKTSGPLSAADYVFVPSGRPSIDQRL
jgi:FkbM family methyltransferase